MAEIDLKHRPELGTKTNYGIGAIGAGFIMRDVHLAAYNEAGFRTLALASRTPENARAAAEQNDVERVYDTWQELLDDTDVEILDIAFPPHQQLEIVREAVGRDHIKGILAQKPLASTLGDAIEIVRLCDEAGTALAVNQNMRYDQSMRALKTLLDGGHLGTPIFAQIVMNARPHWQDFVRDYGRIALLNMSIHHLDAYRYLFGEPQSILVSVRNDPSWDFDHDDGLAISILEYADGLRCLSSDDCFAWADGRVEWRVEGTEGIAKGRIGWPDYPDGSPSTIDYHLRAEEDVWHQPRWDEQWFPQAFIGTMGQLMKAIETGTTPEIPGDDNLRTMVLVEAAYRSASERRTVEIAEILSEAGIG